MQPGELYGMGRESCQIGSTISWELDHFINIGIQMMCYNSRLKNHYICDMKVDIFDMPDEELTKLEEEGSAYKLCAEHAPCGAYGCKKPNEHKLYWVIKNEAKRL